MAQGYGRGAGVAAVVGLVAWAACGFTTSTVVRSGSARSYGAAESDCTGRGGGVAVTTTAGELSVADMSAGGVVWLGAVESAPGAWDWVGGVAYSPSSPRAFWRSGRCVFGLCVWGPGEPRGGLGRMVLSAMLYRAQPGSSVNFYECEVPYTVTFQCFRDGSGTEYDAVRVRCLSRGGYLGTVPSLAAWAAIKASSGCGGLPDTRIGADDYNADAFATGDFRPRFRGFFHWRGGPLGAERGGEGRLLSSGAFPNTVLYGLPTLPYGNGQPTLGASQHTIEVLSGLEQLNDYSWRAVAGDGPPAWVCEFAAPSPAPPPPPPTVPPPPPTTPPTTVVPGSCFPTVDVTVTGSESVSNCRVQGGRVVVTGELRVDEATMADVVIEVVGGGSRTLVVQRSTLVNVGILVRGQFADGSVVRVADSAVTMAAPVDLGQPSGVVAWVHLQDAAFEESGLVELVRNTVSMAIIAPTMETAVVYGSVGTTMDGTPLRVVRNVVQASAVGPTSALVRSDGNVTLVGPARLEVVGNAVTLAAGSRAVLVWLPRLTVGVASVGNVTDNVVALAAARGELHVGDVDNSGLVEWRHNEVQYGASAPVVVGSAVRLATAGSRAVLTENVLSSDGAAGVPTLELRGPVTGSGTLAAGCTVFFGRQLLTLAELRTILPAFANIVLETCTSRFVPTPASGGASLGGGTADGGLSTQSLAPVIIGSVLGIIALVLLAIIVAVLWRRGRRVSHRSRHAKGTGGSSRGSATSGNRRASRSSLRRSSHSGSLTAPTSAP